MLRFPRSKREAASRFAATSLMNVQLDMGIAGNAVLIVSAIFVLVWWPLIEQDWAIAAGRPLGWLALAGSVAAVGLRLVQRDRRHALGNEGPGGWHVPERRRRAWRVGRPGERRAWRVALPEERRAWRVARP